VKRLSEKRFRIILKEGRNRQIRRMVEKVGNRVTQLKRLRISGIGLGKMAPGTWRYLTEKEIQLLTGKKQTNFKGRR
jgi:23S rRNA pseudouridine2605 synthase/23S rRNA pseudouridine2604 synthase